LVKGFTKDGKFRPTEKNTSGITSNKLNSESNPNSIDSGKAQMLKDKNEFVSGEPVVGYINHHAVTLSIDLKQKNEEQKGVDLKLHHNIVKLGISAGLWNLSRSDISQGGQMQDTLRDEFNKGNLRLKSSVSRDEFMKFLDIWDRWHLNDLNAGTTKQRELVDEHRDDEKYAQFDTFLDRPKAILMDFKAEPDNGYSYGSAWLYEPLPDEVVNFIETFKTKLADNN